MLISQYRGENKTYKEIGIVLGISAERVRQILHDLPKQKYCKNHERHYFNFCGICKNEADFKHILENIKNGKIDDHIQRLCGRGRTKALNIQRTLLVKKLRDEYKHSFLKIAELLKRDPSTIMHLYRKVL